MLHYLTERLIEESETVRAAINENPREMALEPCGKDKQQRTYYYMDGMCVRLLVQSSAMRVREYSS